MTSVKSNWRWIHCVSDLFWSLGVSSLLFWRVSVCPLTRPSLVTGVPFVWLSLLLTLSDWESDVAPNIILSVVCIPSAWSSGISGSSLSLAENISLSVSLLLPLFCGWATPPKPSILRAPLLPRTATIRQIIFKLDIIQSLIANKLT